VEDSGIDEDDVRHGDERGDPGEDFSSPVRVDAAELKVTFRALDGVHILLE